MAISATLHCLTGCAAGEITGMIIGSMLGLHGVITVVLSIGLAFLFGYSLSAWSLRHVNMAPSQLITTVLLVDTISILTMEAIMNVIMLLVPGALGHGLVNPAFWVTLSAAIGVAFVATVPVNEYLIKRGKGHALVHEHHQNHGGHQA